MLAVVLDGGISQPFGRSWLGRMVGRFLQCREADSLTADKGSVSQD